MRDAEFYKLASTLQKGQDHKRQGQTSYGLKAIKKTGQLNVAWDPTGTLPLEPLHQSFFGLGIFEMGSCCPGWLPTAILLISASQVAMITGVSHGYTIFS
jgi:hypothetical protein